jgi:hypothetical protein
MNHRDTSRSTGSAYAWIRSNILGLLAIFLALTGTAVAANVADGGHHANVAKKKKVKRGPAGAAGAAGAQGIQGQQGVPGPGATRLQFLEPELDNEVRSIATVGDLKLLAECSDPAAITLEARSNTSGGILSATLERTDTGAAPTFPTPVSTQAVPPDPSHGIFGGTATAVGVNGVLTEFVQGTYNNNADTQVVTFQLVAVANKANGTCTVHGTAVPST